MSDKFTVEIITPDKSILRSEANEVTIPSYEGQMGILKDHIPLITFLRPGLVTIKSEEEKKYFVEEGTIEFVNNNLLILTSKAMDIKDLESNFVDESIKKAKENINQPKTSDKEKYFFFHKIEILKELRK